MSDIVLDEMKKEGIPLTKENYLYIAYMGNPPEKLSAEEEAMLPEGLTDDSEQEPEKEEKPISFRQDIGKTESMNDADTRYNAARHEAGHAVVSELLRPGSVLNSKLDEGGGFTQVNPPKSSALELNPDDVRNLVAVSLAGGEQEQGGTTAKHVSADQNRRGKILASTAATTGQNIERLATGKVAGNDPMLQANQRMAEGQARINALMADPRTKAAIDGLAGELNDKGAMTGDEIRSYLKTLK